MLKRIKKLFNLDEKKPVKNNKIKKDQKRLTSG